MATPAKFSVVDNRPSIVEDNQKWLPNAGHNPARYLVNPGSVKGENRHSAGALRHARPYIVSGQRIFVFPVGTEGFRRSGNATVGIHKNLGEVAVDAHVTHREEGRIELSGTFPGNTSQDAMIQCIAILRSKPPGGIVLYVPGIFNREAYVVPETWDFSHAADDRTHSIDYTISFIRTGEGEKIGDPKGSPAPQNPTVKKKPKGKPTRFFTVAEGARTLRQISSFVYKDANKWQQLVSLNQSMIHKWQAKNLKNKTQGLPSYSLVAYRWPIGTKFRY